MSSTVVAAKLKGGLGLNKGSTGEVYLLLIRRPMRS